MILMAGKKFGRLTVLEEDGRANGQIVWRCRCDCGNFASIRGHALRKLTSTSCGCVRRELSRRMGQRTAKHHRSTSTVYWRWKNMLNRCRDPENRYFDRYGGRGISVCDRWQIFENFFADMGDPPPETYLERRNNDGNYEPSNCYWASRQEQDLNKCSAIWVERGSEKTLLTLAARRQTKLSLSTFRKRILAGDIVDGWRRKL